MEYENPNQEKYPGQRIVVVRINDDEKELIETIESVPIDQLRKADPPYIGLGFTCSSVALPSS